VLPDSFREPDSFEILSSLPQGLDQRSKMEEVVPKMVRRRGSESDLDNPEDGGLDHTVDGRKGYKKNSPSVLSYIDKKTE